MGNSELYFHKINYLNGCILTAEMMEALQNKTELFWEQYRCYPDGVLWGLEICDDNGQLIILPGAIKLENQYYIMKEKVPLQKLIDRQGEHLKEGTNSLLVIRSERCVRKAESITEYCASFGFQDENKTVSTPEIPLGIFRYNKKYQQKLHKSDSCNPEAKLHDMLEPEAVFSLAVNSYSLPGCNCMGPEVSGLMRQCLQEKQKRNELTDPEFTVLLMLCQHPIIDPHIISNYIRRYNDNWEEDLQPCALIKKFLETLEIAQREQYIVKEPIVSMKPKSDGRVKK